MNEIQSTLIAFLPLKRKSTPSGWTSFNAVCCRHRSQKSDTRGRGGILLNQDGGWQYHCFNCGFKAGWSPGKLLTNNTKLLFKWLNLDDTDINRLSLLALKNKKDLPNVKKTVSTELIEKPLPPGSLSIKQWINSETDSEILDKMIELIDYLNYRGMNIDWYPWHWSPDPGYKDRLLIPFYHNGKIVGFTGRKIKPGNPKYLTDSQPGYVFNLDNQINKKVVVVVEGQFDAIGIDACAIMTNEPNVTQITRLKNLNTEIVVVPDKDKAGSKILNTALEHDWSVSCPDWGDDVKDVADAVKKFGRLYTLYTILHYRETNKIKIQLLQKKLGTINV